MAEIGDGDPADGSVVVAQGDPTVDDAGRAVDATDACEVDLVPGRPWGGIDLGRHARGASLEGDHVHALGIQLIQDSIGGQLAVEDGLAGRSARAVLPERDEGEDLPGGILLAEVVVDVAEDATVRILSEEGEDTLLTAAALDHVVLFDQGILAMVGDGMEVQVE